MISFDLVKQHSFNCGQMYVAFSRVTSLDNLYLIGSFTLSAIKADTRAIHEYQRLQNERLLSTLTTLCTSGNSLKIALLNTRWLNKHGFDISKTIYYYRQIYCVWQRHMPCQSKITWKIIFSFQKNKSYNKVTTNLAGFYELLREINFSQNVDI